MVDAQQRPILGNPIQEQCVLIKVTSKPAMQYRCVALPSPTPARLLQ